MTDGGEKPDRTPRVLLLYYSYTGQARRVLDAAGEVFAERGFEVSRAPIEFTDPRYAERFSRFPMRQVWREFFGMLPPQTLRATGAIRTPDEVRRSDYDLIFLKSTEARPLLDGTPFAVFVVCRRYWRENFNAVRKLSTKAGGRFFGEIHFTYPGDQVRSMLSLTSYLGSGEYRDRYLGLRMPPTNVSADQLEESRRFAAKLADRVLGAGSPARPRAAG